MDIIANWTDLNSTAWWDWGYIGSSIKKERTSTTSIRRCFFGELWSLFLKNRPYLCRFNHPNQQIGRPLPLCQLKMFENRTRVKKKKKKCMQSSVSSLLTSKKTAKFCVLQKRITCVVVLMSFEVVHFLKCFVEWWGIIFCLIKIERWSVCQWLLATFVFSIFGTVRL